MPIQSSITHNSSILLRVVYSRQIELALSNRNVTTTTEQRTFQARVPVFGLAPLACSHGGASAGKAAVAREELRVRRGGDCAKAFLARRQDRTMPPARSNCEWQEPKRGLEP